MKTKCLHIVTEKAWRGGENQILQFMTLSQNKFNLENTLAAPKDSEIYQRLRENFTVIPLEKNNTRNVFTIQKYIKENNILNIITHTSKAHSLGLSLKFFNRKLNLIVYRKANRPIKKNPFSAWKYKTKLINHFIAISNTIANTLASGGVKTHKILQSKDFILKKETSPEDLISLKNQLRLNDYKGTVIVCAAHLDAQKNHSTLLKALKALNERNSDFKCFIAGKGPLEAELLKLSNDLKLQERVTFLGFVDSIPELLSLADLFVLPSINEGLGSVLIEAIMYDCALIGSNSGGIPELVDHQKTGLLFDPKSPKDLALKITSAIEFPEKNKVYKENAFKKINDNFNPDSIISDIVKILK